MKLNLPDLDCKTKAENGRRLVFDPYRKKYVALTPEEWVRQHYAAFLTVHKGYPLQRTAIEISTEVNGDTKRCDIVVYDKNMTPHIIVECKAPTVKITQQVFDQIAVYNWTLKARFLIVTNGLSHYYCAMDYCRQTYDFIDDIPAFDSAGV